MKGKMRGRNTPDQLRCGKGNNRQAQSAGNRIIEFCKDGAFPIHMD